jgi:hypothetical protein
MRGWQQEAKLKKHTRHI